MNLKNKKILAGVTGSIAAYKSAELVSSLRKMGAEIRVVMTKNAQQFITPVTMQTLSGNVVRTNTFENILEHIELARWANIIIVAPASANFIARLAYGLADDLLSTLCLATKAKIVLAPAMNQEMWLNSVTQENIQKLKDRNILILGPISGRQACGEEGHGRMLEATEIIQQCFCPTLNNCLVNKNVLITAGPTHEPIDPVRYIGNYSSGKMGYALAEAAHEDEANVTLISGPVYLSVPNNINHIKVTTAQEMYQAVMNHVEQTDILISAAAVSDYRPQKFSKQKIKKTSANLNLDLIPNLDILSEVTKQPNVPITVGFAAETSNIIPNAMEKLRAKNLDLIIANQVGPKLGFGEDQIAVIICDKTGKTIEIPLTDKKIVAQKIIEIIANAFNKVPHLL
jgi:phosphopantothenoylcysteine decarboxylase/phosphopantothenate--cysteine ligase